MSTKQPDARDSLLFFCIFSSVCIFLFFFSLRLILGALLFCSLMGGFGGVVGRIRVDYFCVIMGEHRIFGTCDGEETL